MDTNNLTLFTTADNQELGDRFHSFTAKTRIDAFINFFSSLLVFLFLGSSQN